MKNTQKLGQSKMHIFLILTTFFLIKYTMLKIMNVKGPFRQGIWPNSTTQSYQIIISFMLIYCSRIFYCFQFNIQKIKKKFPEEHVSYANNSARKQQQLLILISTMRKVSYKFPMQITMSEEVHNKIEKAITGIKFSRYSEQTSEEEISKRRIGDIYLNDIYSIIKRISHMYTMQIKLYNHLKDVLEKERLLTRTPLEEGQVINMIDELRKNIALIRNERNIEANVSSKDKVSKEAYEILQQRFQQLNQKYLKTIKQMEYLKAKDESVRKNTSNEGTKRLIIHKDPIQEMYHKMADFQNWSKATINNKSTSYIQNVDKDIERLWVEEIDQLRNNLESQMKAYTELQGKYDQMEIMHKQKLQKLRHELSKEKQSLKKKEFEIKRLSFQQQTLQESNQQLKQALKLEKQQSELLRRNDRKNRRNFSSISAIQSQIEQKSKELYSSLSKAEEEKYKLIESTRKLKGQSQLISERYFSLLGQPLQE